MTMWEKVTIEWDDRAEIAELKQRYIHNIYAYTDRPQNPQASFDSVVLCQPFQSNSCRTRGHHTGFMHYCAKCLREGVINTHSQMDSKVKNFDALRKKKKNF